MKSGTNWMKTGLALAVGTICSLFAVPSIAQVETTQSTKAGPAGKEVTVERGEVVLVNGNDLSLRRVSTGFRRPMQSVHSWPGGM